MCQAHATPGGPHDASSLPNLEAAHHTAPARFPPLKKHPLSLPRPAQSRNPASRAPCRHPHGGAGARPLLPGRLGRPRRGGAGAPGLGAALRGVLHRRPEQHRHPVLRLLLLHPLPARWAGRRRRAWLAGQVCGRQAVGERDSVGRSGHLAASPEMSVMLLPLHPVSDRAAPRGGRGVTRSGLSMSCPALRSCNGSQHHHSSSAPHCALPAACQGMSSVFAQMQRVVRALRRGRREGARCRGRLGSLSWVEGRSRFVCGGQRGSVGK